MDILVLGGGGFIGSHLVDGLLRGTEHNLCVYDLFAEKLLHVQGHRRLSYVHGDIRLDRHRVEELIRASDLVIDLIAHANPSLYLTIPLEVFRLNFNENLRIAELCVMHKKRLIQYSTCEVYGKTVASFAGESLTDPENPAHATFEEDTTHLILGPVSKHRWIYSCAKQLLERILHAYGLERQLNYTIIRPFNFIGPRIDYLPSDDDGSPRVFSHFLKALMDGSPMQLVDGGDQRRSYTYIDDAIDCTLRIVENPRGACDRQIFNIGNPANETTIRGLALRMRDAYARRWWDRVGPLSEIVEVPGEQFYGEGYDDSDRRIPEITKACTLLGWQPKYDLDETIEISMAYWLDMSASDAAHAV
jgi:nucleoside-diphosphate-sugar epimerase